MMRAPRNREIRDVAAKKQIPIGIVIQKSMRFLAKNTWMMMNSPTN
jgi:hypothetical protein